MDRGELERLDRDALIARADAGGIPRAHVLTRPELVDELLLREATSGEGSTRRARGLFGLARDLVARVIERGLNLPDAAERIRGLSSPAIPLRSAPAALPTVTLAEIYAAQGHRARALETVRKVLESEPEHGAARALLAQLEAQSYPGPPAPVLPPEEDDALLAPTEPPEDAAEEAAEALAAVVEEVATEAASAAATEIVPAGDSGADATAARVTDAASATSVPARDEGEDSCVARHVEGGGLLVRWETRESTVEHRRATREGGALAVRVHVVEPKWEGPVTTVHDLEADFGEGELRVEGLPPRYVALAAIGWQLEGEFVSIAHSPPLESSAVDE